MNATRWMIESMQAPNAQNHIVMVLRVCPVGMGMDTFALIESSKSVTMSVRL